MAPTTPAKKAEKRNGAFKWLSFARGGRVPAFMLLMAALFLQVSDPPYLSNFRDRIFDVYQQTQPREVQYPRPVAVIDIDENSLWSASNPDVMTKAVPVDTEKEKQDLINDAVAVALRDPEVAEQYLDYATPDVHRAVYKAIINRYGP